VIITLAVGTDEEGIVPVPPQLTKSIANIKTKPTKNNFLFILNTTLILVKYFNS